jgi:Tol biopolymer transport system component
MLRRSDSCYWPITWLCLAVAAPALAEHTVLVNEIGVPSASSLFIANADGSNEHALLLDADMDYDASFSADGQWIAFTSERRGPAKIFRVRRDGSSLGQLTDGDSFDDQAALSPDGRQLAFVSTREGGSTNIWILEIKTRKLRNLTGRLPFTPGKLHSYFRPAWSPDGRWLAFSSDRDTQFEDHKLPAPGWEHIQRASVYAIHSDGSGLRRLSNGDEFAGSPQWSADGKEIIFYSLPAEQTFAVRVAGVQAAGAGSGPEVDSQLVSVNIATGVRVQRTSGPGLKVAPHFIAADRVAYLHKSKDVGELVYIGANTGVVHPSDSGTAAGSIRNPSWSPDGKQVIYERAQYSLKQGRPIYSKDQDIALRFSGEFPAVSSRRQVALSPFSLEGQPLSGIGIYLSDVDGAHLRKIYVPEGGKVAYSPTWSPDGSLLAATQGALTLSPQPTQIVVLRSDGSFVRALTADNAVSAFPSWSPDGKRIVYRVKGAERGLRIVNVDDGSIQTLTTQNDNFPFWSPDGTRICFTRNIGGVQAFDIFTIRPDGSDLRQLTDSPGNDSHCAWSPDSQSIIFSSSRLGFRDEAPLYDPVSSQPYAELFMMRVDGSDQHAITDDKWEQGTPAFVP